MAGLDADNIFYTLSKLLHHLKPEDADEKHFFLSPERHIAEGLLMAGFFSCLVYASVKGHKTPVEALTTSDPLPLNILENFFKYTLTINLLLQLVYKTMRGWRILSYMLQPCHAATALYLYCMYTSNHKRATKVFQIALHYMFFTALAIALPDTKQLILPFEIENFWIQHYVLLFTPLYLLISGRFELKPSWRLTAMAIGLGGYFHFLAQCPAGLLTGVNVNYMLWPPPGVPSSFATEHYRLMLTALFMMLATSTGYVLPRIANLLIHDRKKKHIHSEKNK
eukprot:TRINITY_DN2166_c0_g1_i1.p1 TRINITY_DN2166_c0_g1~~TRINITY_DN2166_c0_g1_i1.p1  ORF type:complete len:281 (-),score=53.34 TRINITY_DN2166_c0_g1_i1:19-861(-)